MKKEKRGANLSEERRTRINNIKGIIIRVSKSGKKSSYKKIIAEFCLIEGLSRRTIKEYVDLLIDSGQVIRNGDELTILSKQKI